MKKRKLGIIGGSGLYKIEGFDKIKWKKIKTSWGKPSDEILHARLNKEEIFLFQGMEGGTGLTQLT
jgi:5'-methylthioadenosine phosphorylase